MGSQVRDTGAIRDHGESVKMRSRSLRSHSRYGLLFQGASVAETSAAKAANNTKRRRWPSLGDLARLTENLEFIVTFSKLDATGKRNRAEIFPRPCSSRVRGCNFESLEANLEISLATPWTV